LKSAIRDDNPVLILPHKALLNARGDVPDGDHTVPIGSACVRRQGSSLTVVAWSAMVEKSLQAAEQLAAEGIDAEVIDARGVRPFDFATVIASVQKTGRLMLVHEAPVVGGAAAEVVAVIAERALMYLEAPVRRVGAPDVPMPQSAALERLVVPQAEDIVRAGREIAPSDAAA
jgi:pyruvate/2-oxoglutarate/acetoin dehydrogenase E1 component